MPYPSQTDAQAIRTAALEILDRYGEEKVTVRGVAKTLGLSPNAIYRYYKDKGALLSELASEGASILLQKLQEAVKEMIDQDALFVLADSYVEFAINQQSLYSLMMRAHPFTPKQEKKFSDLWTFVRQCVGMEIENGDEAAVALWGYLHGMVGLEQANVFHEGKPRTGIKVGLEALLVGFRSRQ